MEAVNGLLTGAELSVQMLLQIGWVVLGGVIFYIFKVWQKKEERHNEEMKRLITAHAEELRRRDEFLNETMNKVFDIVRQSEIRR